MNQENAVRAEPEHSAKGDCYSAGEREWMEYGQQLRGRILRPFLSAMTKVRVRPDHLSLLSLIIGMAFVPCWHLGYGWLAVLALLLHVAVDGLDGPLARFQSVASPRGSFTDTFCDQLVVSAVTVSLMVVPPGLSIYAGAGFLVLYSGVIAIAMVRSSLQIPYSWLVRPRFFLYIGIVLQLMGTPNVVEIIVLTSNLLLAIKLVTGFFKLRTQLPGPLT